MHNINYAPMDPDPAFDPDPAGSNLSGSGPDLDSAGSSLSGSGLDPDPAGSRQTGSGAPLVYIYLNECG